MARESTAGSPFRVVSRYDWADRTVLRMTVQESSWGGSGTGSVRVAPLDGGGSRVHAEWTHTGVARTRDKVLLADPQPAGQTHDRPRMGEGLGTHRCSAAAAPV